jgi:hypothetical protein
MFFITHDGNEVFLMSERFGINFTAVFTILGGIFFLFIGIWITINTINANVDENNIIFLTPIGIIIALIGIVLIISREE